VGRIPIEKLFPLLPCDRFSPCRRQSASAGRPGGTVMAQLLPIGGQNWLAALIVVPATDIISPR
jgi:hypothetical protein